MTETEGEIRWETVWGEIIDKKTATRKKEHASTIATAIVIWIILWLILMWVATIPKPG